MKPVPTLAMLSLAGAALSSCGGQEDSADGRKAVAGGTILERSITDDMLPYDTLQSQPPLAKAVPSEGAGGTASPDGAGDTEDDGAGSTADDGESTGGANPGAANPAQPAQE